MKESRDSPTVVLYVLGALLLGVGGAWLFLTNREPPAEEPLVIAAPPTPDATLSRFDALPARDVGQTLEMAELALMAGQLIAPEDGSAVFFFRRVLDAEPDNARANEAMQGLLTQLAEQGDRAIANEDYAALAALLDAFALGDEYAPQSIRIRDATAELVASKLAVVDGAIRRGQIVPAQALLGEIETIPGVDRAQIASRRATLEELDAVESSLVADAGEDVIEGDDGAAAVLIADADAAPTELPDAPTSGDLEPLANQDESVLLAADDGLNNAIEGEADTNDDAAVAQSTDGQLLLIESDGEEVALPEPPEDPVVPLLAMANTSFAEGRLVTPENDNAHFYFSEVQRLDPQNSDAADGLRDVMLGLSRRAIAAATAQEWDEADRWLRQAESLDNNLDIVDQTRAQVVSERIEAETGKLIPVSRFITKRIVRPRFPQRALRNEVGGWVLLSFTIATDGTTDDIQVVETSDRYGDQFGRAAEVAVEKWRFEPREFMGQVIAARTQTRVNFDLVD